MTVQSKLPLCSKTKEIRLFREADVEKFEQPMGDIESRVSDMYDVKICGHYLNQPLDRLSMSQYLQKL
jgi:hypothetical protein